MTPPTDFPVDQYRAFRGGYGAILLDAWTSISFTGRDRQTFLHNFCTNEVKAMRPGENREAFITNAKGKILGHGLVDCRDEELVFITLHGQAEKLIAHLERYIIREDVQLRDTTDERSYFTMGPILPVNLDPTARWLGWKILGRDTGAVTEVATASLEAARRSILDRKFIFCGAEVFNAMRLESDTPLYGVDFNDDNLPQEVGRNVQAISFTKGCYLGQETVARIDALGHVNQQLVGVRFDGETIPMVGSELTSGGAVAGRVTSASYSPLLEAPLAIAMVRHKFLPTGTRLDSAAGPCEVVSLPIQTSQG